MKWVLFWVLASGQVGSQSGFDEASCKAAAEKLIKEIDVYHVGRSLESYAQYKGMVTKIDRQIVGDAYCMPLKDGP